ncbi:hypothetical protein D6D04_04873 [Aureobasidium pullulans]|nr:hypothetical protein D6D04_04873 [Aureobasidium pullulans]
MSPPKSDSRDKTERKSLLASATSAVDDLISNLNSKQLLIVELALPIQRSCAANDRVCSTYVPHTPPFLSSRSKKKIADFLTGQCPFASGILPEFEPIEAAAMDPAFKNMKGCQAHRKAARQGPRLSKEEMLFWTDDNLDQGQSTSQALPMSLEVYEYLSSRVPTVHPYLHDDTVLSVPITTTSPYDTVIDPTIATPHSNMDYFNSAASAVLRNNNPMLAVPSEPVPSAKEARKLMSS